MNPWITPEPRSHPWLEWQIKLILQEQVVRGINAQIHLYDYYQQRLNDLNHQLQFAHEALQQRTNQLLFREDQLCQRTQEVIALRQQIEQMVGDIGVARQERTENRNLAVNLIKNITQIFNDTIKNLR